MNGLTDRQQKLLQIVQQHRRVIEKIPTVRELVKLLGVKSTATIHQELHVLRRKGWIK